MLQSLAQLCVALLDFLEQPHILNGDDRLVRESFEEGDLSFGEQLRVDAAENDRTNRGAFSHQGNGKKSSEAHAARVLAALWKFVHFVLHVSDVEGPSV